MRKYSESDYSSSQAEDVLLTSRDLQTRPLIGQYATLGRQPIDNVDISVSFSEFDRFCGDNLVAGKLASLDCCTSYGGILYYGDRVNSECDDITVVSADALGTSSELSFTNTSVDAHPHSHRLLMARTKQTAKNASESRQPGITNDVKEFTCFVCQWQTAWPSNLRRHLALIHKLCEDGTIASPSYRDVYANKRSLKWQREHAVAKDAHCEDNSEESCAPPVAKKQKVKNVRHVGRVNEKGLMGVYYPSLAQNWNGA